MKKNILIITGTLGGGGAEKVLETTLKFWDYTKYSVTLLVICNHNNLHQINNNVNIVYLNKIIPKSYFNTFLHFHKLSLFYFSMRINSIFKDEKFDSIISFSEGSALLCHSLMTNRTENNITWVHCDMSRYMWFSFMYNSEAEIKGIYKKMSHIVCVSESAKYGFIQRFGNLRQLTFIYNLIDKNVIRTRSLETKIRKNKFTIVSCGRFVAIKRFDRVIEIAKLIKEWGYDAEFWIIGKGNELEQKLKLLSVEYGLNEYVRFLGFKSNPYPYIKECDVLLVTSDSEAYPTIICEALCLGKTIISTPVPGCIELLKDGVGIISKFDNVSIAKDLEKLINSKELMQQYECKAKEKGDKFLPSQIMHRIYDLIEK